MFFSFLQSQIKMLCFAVAWCPTHSECSKRKKKKKPRIKSYTPHSPLSFPPTPTCTLLPRSSPRPEAKAPRHAQRNAGTDPTNPPPPSLPLSPLLFFPLSFNNNLGFEFSETHTARKCDCTARTAFPLFSNSLLPPEWLNLFPLPHFFPLAEFLSLPHI